MTGGDGGSKLVMKGSPVRVRASAPSGQRAARKLGEARLGRRKPDCEPYELTMMSKPEQVTNGAVPLTVARVVTGGDDLAVRPGARPRLCGRGPR
jgi:hypothetical protein